MAVVTNKPARISSYMIERLGLQPYFKLVVGGDSLAQKKPHPAPIKHTVKVLGLHDLGRILVVGDSSIDVEAGRAAGALTCGVESDIGDANMLAKSEPDFIVRQLGELIRLFN